MGMSSMKNHRKMLELSFCAKLDGAVTMPVFLKLPQDHWSLDSFRKVFSPEVTIHLYKSIINLLLLAWNTTFM